MSHNTPNSMENHNDQPIYNESQLSPNGEVFWFGISANTKINFASESDFQKKNIKYLSKVINSLKKQD